jgi:hypothetical protein
MNCNPVESDEDSAPESISDTEDWFNWNGYSNNPNESQEDYVADFESDIEKEISIEDLECPEQWDVSAAPNVPGLIRPTRMSKRHTETMLKTVNATETIKNTGLKTMYTRVRQ